VEELKFTLVRKEIPVTLETEEGELSLVMRELTGKTRDAFVKKVMPSIKVGPDGKPQALKNTGGVETYLLHLSLFYVDGDKTGHNVPLKVIDDWPASTQQALFKEAQKLSQLAKDETVQDPND